MLQNSPLKRLYFDRVEARRRELGTWAAAARPLPPAQLKFNEDRDKLLSNFKLFGFSEPKKELEHLAEFRLVKSNYTDVYARTKNAYIERFRKLQNDYIEGFNEILAYLGAHSEHFPYILDDFTDLLQTLIISNADGDNSVTEIIDPGSGGDGF